MAKKMEISAESLLKEFSSQKMEKNMDFNLKDLDISTSNISDALKNLTGEYGVIPGVKPIKDDLKISGRAVTVKTQQDDWGTSLKAIETAKEGEIIFICCDGDDIGVWGELFSKYAQKKGVQSTVIYGAMRDVEAVRQLNYPVFSRSIVPHAGKPHAEGEIRIPLECGGVKVSTGNWIFGDDGGVVVVAEEILQKVISEALEIKKNEDEILHQIEDGNSLSNILGI
ncbi:RraA family protein [uncultured Methanobacterium sp.]|uniref:RraA family protein n=1 Tax=uncultured Methanobacterium sp. TaxID=176306 RepID=UPI002AA69215|nr:RraA family protein [uncultured Methanobacterium sp.]